MADCSSSVKGSQINMTISKSMWRFLVTAILLVGYALAEDHSESRHTNEVSEGTKLLNKETPVRPTTSVRKTAKNADLLRKLGLVKLKSPSASHHRKRLASQSRGARPGDSHVVVVKLPPAPHYYTHSRPLSHPFDHLGVGFFSNGRPSRVSPLNLPLAEKSLQARRARPQSAAEKWQSTLDAHDFRHDDDLTQVHAVSYYKPKGPTKKAFRKYFAANGKLHSFYVMPTHKKKKKMA